MRISDWSSDVCSSDLEGAVAAGHRVVLIDDLLATGGTILATARLMKQVGAEVAAALFVIDLPDLGGSQRLADAGIACATLIAFDGDSGRRPAFRSGNRRRFHRNSAATLIPTVPENARPPAPALSPLPTRGPKRR